MRRAGRGGRSVRAGRGFIAAVALTALTGPGCDEGSVTTPAIEHTEPGARRVPEPSRTQPSPAERTPSPGLAPVGPASGGLAPAPGGSTPAMPPPIPVGPPRPPGWADNSHGDAVPPNYAVALPDGKVSRLDVKIAPADWQRMRTDLEGMLGKFGNNALSFPLPGTLKFTPRDPIYVPATVTFEGRTWRHVGVRYRGNATLAQTWRAGKEKISFRLDFDEYEKEHPEVDDQRFWGMKALALLNNGGDESMVREKVAADLFRAAGVPTPRYAYYRVFVDVGQGPTYFGLYTAAEIPEKPTLRALYGDGAGNLYKPEGEGAKLKKGTLDRAALEKLDGAKDDYRDVEAFHAALHAPRTSPVAWRAGLERTFDTDGFLRWLAVNTAIGDWDTYGVMAHNFYLYGVPSDGGRIRWVPWDHNNAFTSGFLFWAPPSVSLKEVNADWPLIRFLLDDPVYRAAYVRHLRAFVAGPFAAERIAARIRAEHALVAPYIVGNEGERDGYSLLAEPEAFVKARDSVVDRATKRSAEVTKFLVENP